MGNWLSSTYNPTLDLPTKIHLDNLTEEDKYEWPRVKKDPNFHRNLDLRPDPRLQNVYFYNPFSQIFDSTMNMQHSPLCGKIELGMMNCLEAYGIPRGFYACRDLMDDYNECTSENKRFRRCKIMRRERQRQHRDGEREIKYAMPPKPGSMQL